jgi:hypothetical protein
MSVRLSSRARRTIHSSPIVLRLVVLRPEVLRLDVLRMRPTHYSPAVLRLCRPTPCGPVVLRHLQQRTVFFKLYIVSGFYS